VIAGEVLIVVGLILSYVLDLPSGATIILVGVVAFFLVAASRMALPSR